MKKNYLKYLPVLLIFCFSFVTLGLSLVLLHGGSLNILKKRVGASIVNAVPSGSLISDVEFYSELVDSYNSEKGTTYGYDHNFTEVELASLETLTLDEQGSTYHGHSVESLSGLSYLTGLKNLNLRNLTVTEIDLSHNTQLVNLLIDSVAITTLDLSKNTVLASLDVNAPSITKINVSNTNLSNLSLNKPTTAALLAVDAGHDISYLTGSAIQYEDIKDNSFGITCQKYNLAVGESTTCTVKGKTTIQMFALVFKLQQTNENISISNVQKLASLEGTSNFIYYGDVPMGTFNIASFTVTGVAAGTSKIYLTDYSSQNPIGYVDAVESEIVPVTEEISKTIYINKYQVTDSSSNVVSSGVLKTNYILDVINGSGNYDAAYNVAVLGDVKADGMINVQDVAKAYGCISKTNYSSLTDAEILSLDKNSDGSKNVLDLLGIYSSLE